MKSKNALHCAINVIKYDIMWVQERLRKCWASGLRTYRKNHVYITHLHTII